MPDLKDYRHKRDPDGTPEPFGGDAPTRALPIGAPRGFVVQQHAARNMHWDLRLEIGGVLTSWAVPKGPTLDPAERRLAVQTEDHPLEYAEFEGVIPAGNYGAGAMIVWDRGSYRTVDGLSPAEGLERGKLDLFLGGHKLRGRFALVRTKSEDGRQWLLLAKGSPLADDAPPLTDSLPCSVLSGLDVRELERGRDRESALARALDESNPPVGALDAANTRPMLASTADRPFSREGWLFELKYDGVRAIVSKRGDRVRVFSRRGRDVTTLYSEIALAARHLPVSDFTIDGEIVALDDTGRPSFEKLQGRFTRSDPWAVARGPFEIPVVMYAFDLLGGLGRDLRKLPLEDRKAALTTFVPPTGQIRFCDHVGTEGEALFEMAREHGLEGVIAKRADARYEAGRRARTWLKVKVPRSALFAIVGFQRGKGSRSALGSVMLAWKRDGEWAFAGNAGSGLDDAMVTKLEAELSARAIDTPAMFNAPDAAMRGATFCPPEIVCEVAYTEVTRSGQLRHPVFRRLVDVDADQCVAPGDRASEPEVAASPPPEPGLQLSNLDKVFWPDDGYTKGDLLAYYEAAWPFIAPYLEDRPVVLTRYPDGIQGKSFFQKNAPEFTPAWVTRSQIDETDYFLCNDLRTLLYVINSGAIPLHVWSARQATLEKPDWLILDLDPKEAPFRDVIEIARHIHKLLEALGTPHYCKTSGQAGLHVLVPLGRRLDHEQSKRLAEVLARVVVADLPHIATVTRPVAARGDKVYIDYLQNGRGKLVAAPLSARPKPGAPVSMPILWSQVTRRLNPARYTIKTAVRELEKRGDPLRPVLDEAANVATLLAALAERLDV